MVPPWSLQANDLDGGCTSTATSTRHVLRWSCPTDFFGLITSHSTSLVVDKNVGAIANWKTPSISLNSCWIILNHIKSYVLTDVNPLFWFIFHCVAMLPRARGNAGHGIDLWQCQAGLQSLGRNPWWMVFFPIVYEWEMGHKYDKHQV